MQSSLQQSKVFYHIHSDLNGRYTYANNFYKDTFIAVGNDLNTFDSTEKLDKTTLEYAFLAQKKILSGSSNSEIVNLKKKKVNGQMIWTEWEFLPILDSNLHIMGVSCIGYEIPDYLEKALEQANHNQHIITTFADSSAAQISLKDENFNYLLCNEQLARYLQLDKNEIYLKNDVDFYSPEIAKQIYDTDIEAAQLPFGQAINTTNTVNGRFYNSQKFPFLLKSGSIGVGCITVDSTDKTLYKKELESKEVFLKNLTDNIDGAIIQVRYKKLHEPIWEFVSKGINKLFDIANDALMHNPIALRKKINQQDWDLIKKQIEQSFYTISTLECEMRVETPLNTIKWIRLRATPTKEDNGDVVWRGFYEDITNNKLFELKSKQNQELLNNLTNNLDVVLSQIRYKDYKTPKWQYASSGIEKLYEVTFADLQKDPLLIRQMTEQKIFEDINNQIFSKKDNQKLLTEFQITTPSGTKKWIQTSITIKHRSDKSVTIHAFHVDITAKKELENQIVKNERLLQSLTNNVNGLLTQLQIYDENKINWNFLSDGVAFLYEISKDEISVNPLALYQLIHPDDIETASIKFLKCQLTCTLFFSQHRIITKNGTEKWVQVSSTPNRQPDGSTIWNGFHQDITDQKNLEIKNKQTQDQLDFIVNNTVSALFLIENNKIKYISKNYETIFGFSIDEEMTIFNDSIWSLVYYKTEREQIKKQVLEALKKQDNNILLQYQYLHKNGKIIWRQDRINVFYDEQGRAIKIVAIVSDVTKTKRLENLVHRKNEQLAQQVIEKEKITENFIAFQNSKWEEIAANLHDNISQLLFATNLHLNNFSNPHSSYQKAKDILQIATNEIKYITQATKNLVLQDKGLQNALSEFINNNNYLNNIKITKIANSEFYKHFSNSEQIILFTIIQEIIQNAIKHSKSTEVYLLLSIESNSYQIKISDNGVGMPANFNNGMGIYNIEKNVRLLNGTIKMYNDAGLTVEIVLP